MTLSAPPSATVLNWLAAKLTLSQNPKKLNGEASHRSARKRRVYTAGADAAKILQKLHCAAAMKLAYEKQTSGTCKTELNLSTVVLILKITLPYFAARFKIFPVRKLPLFVLQLLYGRCFK
jgi:hypothetical protein